MLSHSGPQAFTPRGSREHLGCAEVVGRTCGRDSVSFPSNTALRRPPICLPRPSRQPRSLGGRPVSRGRGLGSLGEWVGGLDVGAQAPAREIGEDGMPARSS